MENREQEKEELKNLVMKEGDELRKSLLDKLFNFNAILSAAFLLLYQINGKSSDIRILNILPFVTALLILVYQLVELRMLGYTYHKLDNWKDGDIKELENYNKANFNIIFISIILTIIEVGYLFYTFLYTR